ncbi:sugar phosphate isomerase/epimerase and 4-hydroxyphenylpyruvate domain-containing protein [Microbispora sp. NEAU-D428]|uniref:bifunctional sugar phosphate isomerase/epimerase/4-hydroxyphenylpyruvate dioxygenase family protein n=1 Tax=Microbispora sitophila TaxID=2771537 RepID=UPI0018678EDE|nr:sugar phosphate isomerase/epimerase and 4-hydroxyphenylpyruvate domain-containing protein [Microbispora sitophila]MBE3015034.1 sugar phosphate isomerase/epimerase and 4-hydroxyphenylpyruvate domain-containing protein [Microbispora sitophila]
MRKAIATVSLSGTLAEKLDAVAAAGFDGVEIFDNDLVASAMLPEEVRARAADLGLSIDLYQPFRDFEAVPADLLERNLRRARHKFAVMERLGVTRLLVCSNVSATAVDDDALAAGQLRLLAEAAAEHGITIAYEALAWGRHVNEYLHAWRIVRMADHDNLGTCLDSFHILSRGSDPGGIEAIPGDKIFFLQLADAPLMAMDVLQWSRHHRCFPGQGGFDLAGLLAHVLRTGYSGPLSLEVFNDVFRQADTARTAVDAMRSLIALEEETGARLPGAAALAVPPPPVQPTGFAFAELAMPVSAAPPPAGAVPGRNALEPLLVALGFAHTGTHTGKPVQLWEQGEARILLNTGESADVPAVAAIGLESPDPAGSVKRAQSLLSPVLPRRRAPGEAPLDAVAAPDGTALFFCRTAQLDHPSWTGDFAPVRAGRPGDEITHIDHVALTQPWHHFDEAALFYRGVLGLTPQESLELPDPYGLLRSRAMTNAGGTVRIAINVGYVGGHPSAPDAPWQHVALASRDILATARRLREIGGLVLPVPANYYDDLQARHDLASERLHTLRELNLLYDRDAAGEFLHLYTVTAGRMFFEVVQRFGGYQGYGAQNAPIRLAVQHGPVPSAGRQ